MLATLINNKRRNKKVMSRTTFELQAPYSELHINKILLSFPKIVKTTFSIIFYFNLCLYLVMSGNHMCKLGWTPAGRMEHLYLVMSGNHMCKLGWTPGGRIECLYLVMSGNHMCKLGWTPAGRR